MAAIEKSDGLVSIGIVTWNSEKDLPGCMEGLTQQTFKDIEIIAVDNASNDMSLDIIHERFPKTRIIKNDRNQGFCRAHNQAIDASRGQFYLALNPDVQLHPTYIERLVQVMIELPNCGSATGKLWHPAETEPKTIDSAGLFMDRRRHQYLRGHGELDHEMYNTPMEVFGADGAASLFRRDMLDQARIFGEYFDEQFFVYMEDVDLGWRARLFGWDSWFEPRATAIHDRTFRPGHRRPMPPIIRRMAVKNRYLMILKNESPEGWRRDWWRMHSYDLTIFGYVLFFEQSSLGAYAMLRKQWHKALAWRHEIWSRVRVSGAKRLTWFG